MRLNKVERDFLRKHLEGEKLWVEGQIRKNPLPTFQLRHDTIVDILNKIKVHPLIEKLEC